MELLWESRGALWALLGSSWGPLGALLELSWGPLGSPGGPLWAILEAIDQKRGGSLECPPPLGPSKSSLGALLEPSWGALGRSWGRLGGLLGPSWGLLGPSWGHLEASEAHRKRNGEKAKIISFLSVVEGFWHLGEVLGGLQENLQPSCGPLEASWRHDGAHLERSCTVLSHLGGHLGASEALLEPSWAILGAPTPRDRPPPGPGEGVGGGVKTPSLLARRPAHSHPPSQHISSPRASACSAAVFGWAATGNQIRPHVRDAGAQACQARLVRQMRHVLHVRQVYRMLQPRQACHVRGTRSVCQVRPRT